MADEYGIYDVKGGEPKFTQGSTVAELAKQVGIDSPKAVFVAGDDGKMTLFVTERQQLGPLSIFKWCDADQNCKEPGHTCECLRLPFGFKLCWCQQTQQD